MRFYKAARYIKDRLKEGQNGWQDAEVYRLGITEVDPAIVACDPSDFMYCGGHEAAAEMLYDREGAILCKHEQETLIGTASPIPFREMMLGRVMPLDNYSAAGTLALLWDQEEPIGGLINDGYIMKMIVAGVKGHGSRFSAISLDRLGPRGHTCIDRLVGGGLQFTVREQIADLMRESSEVLSPEEMDEQFFQWVEEEKSKDPTVGAAMSAFKKLAT